MKSVLLGLLGVLTILTFSFSSCDFEVQPAVSDSGVSKATVKVQTDPNGNTAEQANYIGRVIKDNEIGAVKHLYIISSYTGDVLEYSTVKGKVTSGGKRLTPKTVNSTGGTTSAHYNWVKINGIDYLTDEVMDEYGTYGESGNYLYWFDAQENYHQYYPSGGTFLHICDRPLTVMKPNWSLTMTQELPKEKTTTLTKN